jgi:hypothetical protein
MSDTSIQRIEAAIDAELDRQARHGAQRIDVGALARTVAGLVDGEEPARLPRGEMRRAKPPSDLNASNDG